MRDRIYYMMAITVLLVAIIALVVVLGQNQPTTSQQTQGTTNSFQTLFTQLTARVNSDANFAFDLRATGLSNGEIISISQSGTRVAEIGTDYFCLQSNTPSRVCSPYSSILALRIPQ